MNKLICLFRRLKIFNNLFFVICFLIAPLSIGQTIPSTIKVIIPFAPGGPTDVLGRIIAETLQKNLKTTVIIENRQGENGEANLFYQDESLGESRLQDRYSSDRQVEPNSHERGIKKKFKKNMC